MHVSGFKYYGTPVTPGTFYSSGSSSSVSPSFARVHFQSIQTFQVVISLFRQKASKEMKRPGDHSGKTRKRAGEHQQKLQGRPLMWGFCQTTNSNTWPNSLLEITAKSAGLNCKLLSSHVLVCRLFQFKAQEIHFSAGEAL